MRCVSMPFMRNEGSAGESPCSERGSPVRAGDRRPQRPGAPRGSTAGACTLSARASARTLAHHRAAPQGLACSQRGLQPAAPPGRSPQRPGHALNVGEDVLRTGKSRTAWSKPPRWHALNVSEDVLRTLDRYNTNRPVLMIDRVVIVLSIVSEVLSCNEPPIPCCVCSQFCSSCPPAQRATRPPAPPLRRPPRRLRRLPLARLRQLRRRSQPRLRQFRRRSPPDRSIREQVNPALS